MKTTSTKLRILVCGDREWHDEEMILAVLRPFSLLDLHVVILDGGARGADELAQAAANQLMVESQTFHADWKKHGKAAGPIRNQKMLDEGQPHLVLAFHTNIDKSKGTRDMVNRARRAGVPTCVFPQKRFAG